MSQSSERVKSWRKATKQRMVAAMGGKCQCCGYDRCMESLDFHHVDPKQKEMALGSIRANPKAWGAIVNELRKCILICRNCHGEIHYTGKSLPESYAHFDERYADFTNHQDFATPCLHCGRPKAPNRKHCSRSCSAAARYRTPIDWNQINLAEMIKIQSCRQIGDVLGCTGKAVGDHLKKEGIVIPIRNQRVERNFIPYEKPAKPLHPSDIDANWRHAPKAANRKVEWPSKDILEKLIWEKSILQISKDYGVSDNAVRKWCARYEIQCPTMGYWQRRHNGYSHEESLVSQAKIVTPKRWITKEIAEKAAALRLKGQSYRDVGTALGFGHWSIQSALRRYGLEDGCFAPARTEDIRVTIEGVAATLQSNVN